jgi:hypothetical protein
MRATLLGLFLAGCSSTLAPLGGRDLESDSGLLPFGATCTMDAECATGHCFSGSVSFCTMPCTPATVTTDCPVPPTSGICNMKGFCRH